MARSAPPPPVPGAAPTDAALRMQILATEHWSLLASRSTAQSEVLTRIAMFLTFVSATLVSLALVGQATRFGQEFIVFAVAVLTVALAVGVLTQVRVVNVALEDLMYVMAMNRLRGEYARLAPGVETGFMTSPHDDLAGVQTTYYFLGPARGVSQVLGSSMVFIFVVNAALAGLLIATVVLLATGAAIAAIIAGAAAGVLLFAVSLVLGHRGYAAAWRRAEPRYPSPVE